MINRKSIAQTLLILSFIFLSACDSTPAAANPPVTFTVPTTVTGPTVAPVIETSVAPAPNPTDATPTAEPFIEPSGLKVAFVLNGNVWYWSESTPARQLTSDGDAEQVKLSDDGEVIAYQRGQILWAVYNNGSSPHQLVDAATFTASPFLGQFDFQPNSHMLYFGTRASPTAATSNDLQRVDADSSTPAQILLTQGGGKFTFSPDGRLIALAQATRINTAYTDGAGLISALDFTQVNTYSDWLYLPQVVWLEDSTGFYTVIPASDPVANPGQKSRFLYVAADGSFSAQLAEFIATDVRASQPLIAPNGSKVAYATQNGSTLDLHVIDASTADAIVASHSDAGLINFWAWSPDSARFAYFTADVSRPLLTGMNFPSTPLMDALAPYSLTWVSADRFLYFRDGELRLGQIGKPLIAVISMGFPASEQDTRYYDFAP